MLRSLKQLYGNKLGASDGEIGQVKDFYFDDQSWAIRYLIADTGTWLPGRQVLISPYSIGRLDQGEKVLRVNLTRKQIENSPSIESRKPVSRQYEEEYYRYFGWPYYWQGDALWGLSGFPILELPPNISANEVAHMIGPQPEPPDVHLRSAQAVIGYQLWTTEQGVMGYVCDFMLNDQTWAIDQLTIKTGHRFSGKEVLISAKDVDRISYDESTIFATFTRKVAAPTPAPDLAATMAAH
jgi:uncharacterized protein (DUF2249 family)